MPFARGTDLRAGQDKAGGNFVAKFVIKPRSTVNNGRGGRFFVRSGLFLCHGTSIISEVKRLKEKAAQYTAQMGGSGYFRAVYHVAFSVRRFVLMGECESLLLGFLHPTTCMCVRRHLSGHLRRPSCSGGESLGR